MKQARFVWILLLALAVILSGCGGTATQPPAEDPVEETVFDLFEKGRQIESLSYDIVMEMPETVTGKVWLKQDKMRMEMTAGGHDSVMIIDGDAKVAYAYMPSENIAYKIPFATTEEEFTLTPSDFLQYEESKIETGDTVFLNGVECLKVHVDDGYRVTMWIHKEYGLPVRVEVELEDNIMVWEFRNLSIDPIPDEVFHLPAGVTVHN
jgi:outer membrane lipoprotein-sorting protein